MNKAILIISVGTSETAALEATTMRMQQEATEKFGLPCYVAYSSKFILKRMQEKETGEYLGIADAVKRMKADGIEEAYVQPTYLLNGVEMEDMTAQITEAAGTDFSVKISRPLLMGKPDYIQALEHILDDVKLTEEEALVLIGHGTSHLANTTYQNFEYTAYMQGCRNVFVGTMKEDRSRQMALRKIAASGYHRIRLMPLLFVAGYHAKRDLINGDGSWEKSLIEAGCDVAVYMKGLGEIQGIRDMFLQNLQEIL